MTPVAIGGLIIAIVLAVGDWWAVIRDSRRLEYWCKPGATMALVVVAATLNPTNLDARALIVVALVASLAGDVFLMLPKDHFVAGLGAFFIAQVLYAVAFVLFGVTPTTYLIVAGVVILLAWPLARRIIKALRNSGQSKLVVPVVAYLGAISAMVIGAISSGNAVAAIGALLFMLSDSLIAESRFIKSPLVKNKTLTQLAIMVTYYLAQGAIVLSLLV